MKSRHTKFLAIGLTLVALAAIPGNVIASNRAVPPLKQSAISASSTRTKSAIRGKFEASYGQLPLAFEINEGQSDPRVKFLCRGAGYGLFLTGSDTVLALTRVGPGKEPLAAKGLKGPMGAVAKHTFGDVLHFKLPGANTQPQVEGIEPLPGKSNYFIGNDPKKWRTNVPQYARVKSGQIYPGIDLVYYGRQRQLEYDFQIAPGADPGVIRFTVEGAQKASLNAKGDLVLQTPGGDVIEQAPMIYQEVGGKREMINGGYEVRRLANVDSAIAESYAVSFRVASYDQTKPLVIDPVLAYSTYLGGSGEIGPGNSATDAGEGVAVDNSGNAYVTGETVSTDFPTTTGTFQPAPGVENAFVVKLNTASSGSAALVYSTYLSGTGGGTSGSGIAVDGSGNAYVTGQTYSTNFPTTSGAVQTTLGSIELGVYVTNVFVTKLNSTGSMLLYSTYLGGDANAYGNGIAVDSTGYAYVTGDAYFGFPSVNGIPNQPSSIGEPHAFVSKLNPDPALSGSAALVYSTLLSGIDPDGGDAIAVDKSGNAYVTGATYSYDFPTTPGAFQRINNAAVPDGDEEAGFNAFVAKLNTASSGSAALVYSTFLGGGDGGGVATASGNLDDTGGDEGNAIAVDDSGNAYVTGEADSSNFPLTAGAFQKTNNSAAGGTVGLSNAFVTKLNPAGSALVYSTYLGGSGGDGGGGIAIDGSGNAYVTGATYSIDFPTTPGAIQTTNMAVGKRGSNVFVTKLNAVGSELVYSTYLGGSSGDSGNGIAVDGSGNAYVTGYSFSTDFPTTSGAYHTAPSGTNGNAFVARLNIGAGTGFQSTAGTVFKITTSGSLTTLYSFTGGNDGGNPYAGLVTGTDGNFYGTTLEDGAIGAGTVFEITTSGSLATLYSFTGGSDGGYPYGGLAMGTDGNFYGTTETGGGSGFGQYGTVFQITTSGSLTTLYSFTGTIDGGNPYSGLVRSDGNFYGTTIGWGANGYGTVFTITTSGSFNALYSFQNNDDGANPYGGLATGTDGNLYGTTEGNFPGSTEDGGGSGYGTVFQITTSGTLDPLHMFTGGADGADPYAGLVQAQDGNFYGTTESGGVNGCGTVFTITASGSFSMLHSFSALVGGTNADGANPYAGLVTGTDGNLYGTTVNGGSNGAGTVFRITTTGSLTSLHSFTGGADGGSPYAGLVRGIDGNFYGTTITGGSSGAISTPAPAVTSGTASATSGQLFTYQIAATNDPTSYSDTGLPSWLTVNTSSGLLSGTPTASGTFSGTISAKNGGGTGNGTLTIIVAAAPPPAPVVSAIVGSGTEGLQFSYQIAATNSPTGYEQSGIPWLGLNPSTGLLSGTPTASGTFSGTITASNAGGTGTSTVLITVVPQPPVVSAVVGSGTVGDLFTSQISASNNPTIYGESGIPWLNVNPLSGALSGTPTSSGTFSGTVTASNAGGTGTSSVLIIVVPQRPVVSAIVGSGTVGDLFTSQISATNNPTSYGESGVPWLNVNPLSGALSGTPTSSGTFFGTITATNAGGPGNASLSITVAAAILPAPLITSGTAASATVGQSFTYQITATNSPTSFGESGMPAWLSVNTSTGLLSGTPTASGTFSGSITATNAGGPGNATLTITVAAAVPPAPVITSGTTASATVGQSFTYQITATNSPTSFGESGLPAWLSVNTSTGLLSGTPTASGTFSGTISATNAGGTGNGNLTIIVAATPPAAPSITSGSSAVATVGQPFNYLILGTNNPTSFGANGLPPGLNVNASTGEISGTPTTGGTFAATISAINTAGTGSAILSFAVETPGVNYAVTPIAGSGGGISPSTPQLVASGGSIGFTATAASGYLISQWLVNLTPQQNGGSSFLLSNVTSDTSVAVTFVSATSTSAMRTLPPFGYIPGTVFTVTIAVNPASTVTDYAVQDAPPAGWAVSNISTSGTYDAANGEVEWGPFFDNVARTLTYQLTPPATATGVQTFSGVVSFNGVSTPITGDDSLAEGNPQLNPADESMDSQIVINDVTGYGAAWKTGESWLIPPNPIDINYVTWAGNLWKNGQSYYYNSTITPPQCWELGTSATSDVASFKSAIATPSDSGTVSAGDTATRTLPATYTSGSAVSVSIVVTSASTTSDYAVQDAPPAGWTNVSNISSGGAWDSVNNLVKWGPFFQNTGQTLTYEVTPPSGTTGVATFSGTASFDGASIQIGGSNSISSATLTYTVTPSAGAGGTISPNTAQVVDSGSSVGFTATPNSGYVVNQWLLNGSTAQTGGTSYTLSDVTANDTVEVTFATAPPVTYTVTPSAGTGGTISPNTAQVVDSGSTVGFTATPSSGYVVNQWLLNGSVAQTSGTSFTLTNVTANDTVEVTFTSVGPASRPNLYVGVGGNDTVGEFNSGTGLAVNPSLITGINGPADVAISGNNLFVAVSNGRSNTVGEYNATTGATINASFITGPQNPTDLLVVGNNLFVSHQNTGNDVIGEYNATTGKAINASFISGGLIYPAGLAISGNHFFVANQGKNVIGEYNATTGVVIKSRFITGLNVPGGIAISGNNLYVTNFNGGTVGEYDATTGAPINPSFITGLTSPANIAISGNNLFVTETYGGIVGEYDATTGAPINASLITGIDGPTGLAVDVPQPSVGKYTVLLYPIAFGQGGVPQGIGYATMIVNETFGVTMTGKLPDGESFSGSGYIVTGTAGSQFVINKSLTYPSAGGVKGSLAGTLTFATVPGSSDFSGTLAWYKPPQGKGDYPEGISTNINVIGSVYTPPKNGTSVLPGFASGTLEVRDASGLSLNGSAQLTPPSKVTIINPPDKMKVSVTASTGVFTGSFMYPVAGKSPKLTNFSGVLFQDQTLGAGFFLGPNGSGTVSLTSP